MRDKEMNPLTVEELMNSKELNCYLHKSVVLEICKRIIALEKRK